MMQICSPSAIERLTPRVHPRHVSLVSAASGYVPGAQGVHAPEGNACVSELDVYFQENNRENAGLSTCGGRRARSVNTKSGS